MGESPWVQGGERICSSRGAWADPFLADYRRFQESREAWRVVGNSPAAQPPREPEGNREPPRLSRGQDSSFPAHHRRPRGVAWPPPPQPSSGKQAQESRQRIRELRNVDPSLTLRGSRQALPLIHLCLLPCPLPPLHLALRKPRGFEQLSA